MHDLTPLSKAHSPKYSGQILHKSEMVVLDVLLKNKVKCNDLLDIVSKMQEYLSSLHLSIRLVHSDT